MEIKMFVILNEMDQRLSNAYSFKFVESGFRCCTWKKKETADNFLKRLEDEGRSGIRVVEVDDEDPKPNKKERKPKESKEETSTNEDVEPDETSFFESGFNEKCLRCELHCKQSALAKIIRCPSFKKIK